jgi:hypothetical protein
VTGYGCDDGVHNYQHRDRALRTHGSAPLATPDEAPGSLRYGSDVVARLAGPRARGRHRHREGDAARLRLRPRVGGEEIFPLLEHWFPASGPSEALGVLVDAYDRIFVGGYITANGATQARLVLAPRVSE